ncbi:hypothetical protein EG327_005458 [Venturia inaequalis]|uniref:Uncharacterized protein n=2 Tax=Venturia inaequalis TaxID=5025 RepID=A0A8H3Z511_VENIN|nr:hypothetical protein EG327_005458 [Venturia inaequalis]
MSPSGDAPSNSPSPNLNFPHQRQRIRPEYQNSHSRTQSQTQNDINRMEAYGEKLSRIYPRELRKSPGAVTRYPPPTSPYPITSPLLSALGSTTNTAAQYTSDWTKSLPFFSAAQQSTIAGSPPNPIPVPIGRDVISPSPPSLKPRSHPNNNAFPSYSPLSHNMAPTRDRRASVYSQYGNSFPNRGRAPLPHEDQAHFYPGGLPDLDTIGMPPRPPNELPAGENGYLFAWDSLATSGHQPSLAADNVLLVGHEGGVDILKIHKKRDPPSYIGSLRGLKGAVIGGKILPWFDRKDPSSAGRPYIALIIHGPVIEDLNETHNSSDESPAISLEDGSPEPSTRPPSSKGGSNEAPHSFDYVTTVEIYSLSDQKHVATLYTSPRKNITSSPFTGLTVPPPIGDLQLDANGRCVVVASGDSGEVFIFSPYSKQKSKGMDSIRCVGKLWTTVRQPEVAKGSNGTPALGQANGSDKSASPRSTPLFALSHRWIAIVPPSSAGSFPLGGAVLLSESARKPPGVSANMAPLMPQTTCMIDTPEGSDFMNRMSRELTQNAIKGGKWLFDQGLGAWNNYMGKPSEAAYRPAEPAPAGPFFPPTHGYHSSTPTNNEPTKVSIYDLQRFLDSEDTKVKNVFTALATFELASGCSFLSFDPSGMNMFTASRKGDEQFVWQLMKMRDTRTNLTSSQALSGPHVRQIENLGRMTPARIVDVAWSMPHGARLAVFTEHGTVHVHEIHPSKFQWPPARRAKKANVAQRPLSADLNSPRGGLSSALGAVKGTGAWFKSTRDRSLSGHITLGNLAMTPANLSKKAVKAGFKQGASAVASTVVSVYQVGDNKLRLQSTIDVARPNTIRWMTGQLEGKIAVAAAGVAVVYPVRSKAQSGKGRRPAMKMKITTNGAKEYKLPGIPILEAAPAVTAALEARSKGTLPEDIIWPNNKWTLRAPHSSVQNKRLERENWHVMVEAETNPPYQPFHTDRRVTLQAFAPPDTAPPALPYKDASAEEFREYESDRHSYIQNVLIPHTKHIHHINDDAPWLFGAHIDNLRTIREGSGGHVDGFSFNEEDEEMENQVEALEGRLVMTTIRTRKSKDAEEEFFEDDAEFVDYADNRV